MRSFELQTVAQCVPEGTLMIDRIAPASPIAGFIAEPDLGADPSDQWSASAAS